jgi:hypothetical protein
VGTGTTLGNIIGLRESTGRSEPGCPLRQVRPAAVAVMLSSARAGPTSWRCAGRVLAVLLPAARVLPRHAQACQLQGCGPGATGSI